MPDILARDLLTAAGWDEERSYGYMRHAVSDDRSIFTSGGFLLPDDNLCDMLIRELSESQVEVFEDELCTIVGSAKLMCTYGASLLRATPEQKAQALMETYKENE